MKRPEIREPAIVGGAPRRQRPSGRGPWIAGGAVILVVAAVGAAFLLTRPPTPAVGIPGGDSAAARSAAATVASAADSLGGGGTNPAAAADLDAALPPAGPLRPLPRMLYGALHTFLQRFALDLSTGPASDVLREFYPGASALRIRRFLELTETFDGRPVFRLDVFSPRGIRGDTAEVRFVLVASVSGSADEKRLSFESRIAPSGHDAALAFTELRPAAPDTTDPD